MIPPVNSEILYDRARSPKRLWIGPGRHSNVITADFAEYQKRVLSFYGEVRGR